MQLVSATEKISLAELKKMAGKMFGDLVKAVVDLEKNVMVVDTELHADAETWLLDNDSEQKNLWGINLYPDLEGDDFVEFDSMINLRPSQGNRSRGVEDPKLREQILKLVQVLVVV